MKTPLRATLIFLAATPCVWLSGEGPSGGTAGDDDREVTKAGMIDGVAHSWKLPAGVEAPDRSAATSGPRTLAAKLDAIVVPEVSFNNLELDRAMSALAAVAREFDTTDIPPKGVNFVLLDPAHANPKLTLNLRQLTLRRIIDFVTDAAGCRYEVAPDAVVVRPAGERPSLSTEVFPLGHSTVIRMTRVAGEKSAGGGPAPGGADGAAALRRFLQSAGIDFDGVPASSLAFDGSAIIVTQTLRNLERIRAVVGRYREVRQVEIEAKFMEVQEGALDELGIQWDVGRRRFGLVSPETGEPLRNPDGSPRVDYRERYRTANPADGSAVNRTLADAFRHAQHASDIVVDDRAVASLAPPTLPGANNLGEAALNLATITGTIGEFDVNAVIRALAQKSGSDLLSAPRVTVLSGSEALITVAQEMRYPQSFGEIQSQVGNGRIAADGGGGAAGVAITAGTPQEFATRNVGVELRVTPTVEEDGLSISLELHPKVTEFEGFIEYGGPSIAISGGRTVTIPPGFYQPIFSVREVKTQVTIWDGATIVMGGLTREEVKQVEDKVPILGDIPLLGRAFRSKGQSSQKRNLLIFVTARLVDPGGASRKTRAN